MIVNSRLNDKPNLDGIQVIKDYGNLPLIQCYPGQLNQAFMNILVNAIDALESQRERLDNSQGKPQPQIHICTEVITEDRIKITIADNGVGIPEAIQSRLFDPFFTTKPVGKGTGMGLAISYQIVTEQHHGTLMCHSILGQGSRFEIEILTQNE
jgi:two-component system, NtrC family, sensor kinase